MSADFGLGVAVAMGGWLGMAGTTIVTLSWVVSRTRYER